MSAAKASSYTESLREYLHGDEWRENVDIFIRSNCGRFRLHQVDDCDESHKRYELWRTFQEIVESILEVALINIGGSMSSLERALDEVSRTRARGPRTEAVADIAERLMCFSDYHAFVEMMCMAAQESMDTSYGAQSMRQHAATSGLSLPMAEAVTIPPHPRAAARAAAARYSESSYQPFPDDAKQHQANSQQQRPSAQRSYPYHRESLERMGFDPDLVDSVLPEEESEGQELSLDQLVVLLSELSATNHQPHGAEAKNGGGGQNLKGLQIHPPSPTNGSSSATSSPNRYRVGSSLPHIDALALACNIEDPSVIAAKFTIARSILESFASNSLSSSGGSAMLMLQWASEMADLSLQAEEALASGKPNPMVSTLARDSTSSREIKNLAQWYDELEVLRRQCDDAEANGCGGAGMASDAELQRMAELDRLASLGSEDEALMHSLIVRHDRVREELNVLHQRCGALIAVGSASSSSSSLSSSSGTGAGSGSGVSRETLEELYLYLKDKVASGADLGALSEELHEHVYTLVPDARTAGDCVTVLLDMHILEDEQYILRQRINAMLSPGGGQRVSPDDVFFAADAKDAGTGTGTGSAGAGFGSGAKGGSPHARAGGVGASPAEGKEGGASGRSPQGRRRFDHKEIYENAEKGVADDVIVAALMNRHKASVAQLKASLDAEKDRRLSELEQRLHRRRMLRDKELAAARAYGVEGPALGELEQSLDGAEREIKLLMGETVTEFDATKASLVSGFKRRCIYEIKACKEKGSPLSEDEQLQAQRDAAEAIRKRHERDSLALLTSLADQKEKHRQRLASQIARRKEAEAKKAAGKALLPSDIEHLDACDSEAAILSELKELDMVFREQERAALRQTQEQVLLQLAGAHIAADTVNPKIQSRSPQQPNSHAEGDGDDGYLLSPRGAVLDDTAPTRRWLQSIEGLRDAFLSSSGELQARLSAAFAETEGLGQVTDNDSRDPEDDSEFQKHRRALAAYMSKVVISSFNAQVSPPSALLGALASGSGNANGSVVDAELLAEKVRRALISEFEKSQSEYSVALDRAKESSAMLLKRRRQQAWGGAGASNGGAGLGKEGPKPVGSSSPADIVGAFAASSASDSTGSSAVAATFVDTLSSRGYAYTGGFGGGSGKSGAARRAAAAAQAQAQAQQVEDEEQGRAMVRAHTEKEAALLRGLAEDMAIKKAMLANRLKKKKDQQEKAESKDAATSSAAVEEQVHSDAESALEIASLERDIALLANEMAAIGSTGNRVGHVQQQLQHRERMEQEARRISDSFSAEQQRHDLIMKMQQARQRQSLQRKLLERKGGVTSGAMGSADASLGLAGSGPGAALAAGLLTPSKQPAFRGLEDSMSMDVADSKFVSTDKSGIAGRGLSTQHLHRK